MCSVVANNFYTVVISWRFLHYISVRKIFEPYYLICNCLLNILHFHHHHHHHHHHHLFA